jgi:hypothetical protein
MVEEQKPETPRDRLLRLHDELCSEAKRIMRKKNADYGRDTDPWFNFRRHGPKGILVRIDDKLCRMDNFVETGTLEAESLRDAILDNLNYHILLYGMLRDMGKLGDSGA